MIDRRIFLQLTGGAAAGAAGLTVTASPDAAAVAALANPSSRVSVGDGVITPIADPLSILRERLELASNGRLVLRAATEAGNAAGGADRLILANEGEFAESEPLSLLLGGCPIHVGAATLDVTTWLRGAGGQALWDMATARHGWKPLMVAKMSRTDAFVWSRAPLDMPRSFSGLRIAVPHALHEPLQVLGAVPTAVSTSRLVSAFEAGTIDAFETDDPSVSLEAASRLPREVGWFSGSLAGTSRVISLRIPLAQWRVLSPADQALIEAVAEETAATLRAVRRVQGPLVVAQIAHRRGHGPGSLRGDTRLALSAESVRLLAPMAAEDEVFASALASMTALVEPVFRSDSTGLI